MVTKEPLPFWLQRGNGIAMERQWNVAKKAHTTAYFFFEKHV